MYMISYRKDVHDILQKRCTWYLTEIITDAAKADNLAPPAQAESLLHNLEQTVEDIGLNMNRHKTEFTYFKENGAISTWNDQPLKLVDHFTYLDSNISSTEYPWWNKAEIIPSCSWITTIVWLHQLDLNKTIAEKAEWELYNDMAHSF